MTSHGVVAGVDGCPGGWICIERSLRDGSCGAVVHPSATELFERALALDVLAIDIPIGLTDAQDRDCDSGARRLLGRRACCVFSAPLRPMLVANSWHEAHRIGQKRRGKGLSRQAFAILPKIKEVDSALRARRDLRGRVREVHPELSFREMNGGRACSISKHKRNRPSSGACLSKPTSEKPWSSASAPRFAAPRRRTTISSMRLPLSGPRSGSFGG